MNEIKQYEPLVSICQKLLVELPCDFVGVAIQNQRGPDVRWHYAVGNGNDKYKRITVRYGKGIAGLFQQEDRLKWLIFQITF